jgi:hypothetical protein
MQARYIYGMHVHTIHTQNQELSQLIEFKRFQQMIDDFKLHEQGYKQFHAILLQSQNLSSFLAKNYPEYSAEFNKIWNLHYKNLRKNSPNVALF